MGDRYKYYDIALREGWDIIPMPYPEDVETPDGYDMCIAEMGEEKTIRKTALILLDYTEVANGSFKQEFKNPVYVFIKNSDKEVSQ
jgi:hypothetical protein